jgi:hypothetical protein
MEGNPGTDSYHILYKLLCQLSQGVYCSVHTETSEAVFKKKCGIWTLYSGAKYNLTLSHSRLCSRPGVGPGGESISYWLGTFVLYLSANFQTCVFMSLGKGRVRGRGEGRGRI